MIWPAETAADSAGTQPPNKRLKLAAPVVYGRIAFVNRTVWLRSLGAIR
jgi:hypothetical protein